jgi:hypothetical protein
MRIQKVGFAYFTREEGREEGKEKKKGRGTRGLICH